MINPSPEKPKNTAGRTTGTLLVVFSFIAYGLLFVVPFLPLSAALKVGVSSVLVVAGEITFWVGGALLGKEMVKRYRRYLNPCAWFHKG